MGCVFERPDCNLKLIQPIKAPPSRAKIVVPVPSLEVASDATVRRATVVQPVPVSFFEIQSHLFTVLLQS